MATFRASKRFHFSDDGRNPWAVFEHVPGSDPAEYVFVTTDPAVADRLVDVAGVETVDLDDLAAPKSGRKPARKAAAVAPPADEPHLEVEGE